MNYSTALFLILSSTAAASSSEAQHSTINKNRRSLTDLSYNDETHGAVSEAEYEELVNWREAITSYWTPDRLSSVTPLHNVINDNIDAIQSNSTHYLDNGTWRRRNLLRTNDDGRKLAVTDSPWTGGDIHHAAGRLVFTKDGNDYLCSATAIKDGSMDNGRSIIVTAGHCVYDDATKKVCKTKSSTYFTDELLKCIIFHVVNNKTHVYLRYLLYVYPLNNIAVCFKLYVHPTPRRWW